MQLSDETTPGDVKVNDHNSFSWSHDACCHTLPWFTLIWDKPQQIMTQYVQWSQPRAMSWSRQLIYRSAFKWSLDLRHFIYIYIYIHTGRVLVMLSVHIVLYSRCNEVLFYYIYARSWAETVLLKISNEIKLQFLWEFLAVWLQSLLYLKKKKEGERQRERKKERQTEKATRMWILKASIFLGKIKLKYFNV